eukprot:11184343-Lingulodinium_polyedra.AAC.1
MARQFAHPAPSLCRRRRRLAGVRFSRVCRNSAKSWVRARSPLGLALKGGWRLWRRATGLPRRFVVSIGFSPR